MKIPVSFQKSLGFLTHPVSLVAVALILLNDWALKPWKPSWLTGKLSDLGALWITPCLLVLLLTILLLPWLGRRPRLAGGLAYGLVLAVFVLLKLSPATNAWLVEISRQLSFPIRAVADPTDLLCLPAWGLSAWFWSHSGKAADIVVRQRRWHWQVLLAPIAALALFADAAAPDYGVHCLFMAGETIQAYAGYGEIYASQDGGMSWSNLLETGPTKDCTPKNAGTVLNLKSPDGQDYRVTLGQSVELSTAGGGWQTVFQTAALSQAEQTYLLKTRSGNPYYRPGPLDAVVDPVTGNLVLAMGHEGVLVLPPSKTPVWVAVSVYRHNELRQSGAAGLATLLNLELWLGAGAALIWVSTSSLRRSRTTWQIILTAIGWLLLALAILALYPGLSAGNETAMISVLVLLATLVWSLVLAVIALVRHWKDGLVLLLLLAPLMWGLFLLPYLLWGLLILPEYWDAAALAGLVLLAATAAAYRSSLVKNPN